MARRRELQGNYKQRRVRGEGRTIPIFGTSKGPDDDRNTLYECWNCGWTCNIEVDPLGGQRTTAANYRLLGEPDALAQPDNAHPLSFELDLDTQGSDVVLMELDAAGDDKQPYVVATVFSGGCPLCGTRAYKL